MLSREVMSVFLLAVLWVNVLLVAGGAWIDSRALPSSAARLRSAGAFIAALLSAAAACTALATSAPRFGPRGALGSLLGLALFLGMQPLGTMLRDRMRRERA